ncbi:polysaccharide deacetylase family protein [Wenyingzhuangia sp. chi5]|uniref:Polysaccharide deacetylase family protein n=2 Tax=Wenyingzhuangia gilva TaxID=3057677 RepID=A0ABT8VPE0_9FLAO|nr:polysaccharide deacetylase family protein [Wenyingzhuangia sp. chi5]
MMIIYSDIISSRLIYTLNVIFKYVIGIDYELTNHQTDFETSFKHKINYSVKNIDNSLQIIPSNLLFQKGVVEQDIQVDWIDEIPFLFKTNGELPYDIFAATFYMITRYEEYLPFESDIHGRFSAENSLAFKNGFLKKPVVNLWVMFLQKKLLELSPNLCFPIKKISFLNTLDIDIAYAYKAKGIIRFWGGFAKAILKRNQEEIGLRKNYITSKKDPFDTYNFIEKHSENVNTQYFFLLGNRAEFDNNIHPSKRGLKKLILKLSQQHKIGIHPSYQSNQKPEKVAKEIKRLEKILGDKITISRQHFLKMSFPSTYENLINNGVKVDYTMGFASQVGFRAGICNVYPFYNLEKEAARPLWIVPFQVMDGTLNQYLKLNPEQGIQEIKSLIDEVNSVNGLFVSLWHNSSLSETDIWKGWRKVYKEMLTLMK